MSIASPHCHQIVKFLRKATGITGWPESRAHAPAFQVEFLGFEKFTSGMPCDILPRHPLALTALNIATFALAGLERM